MRFAGLVGVGLAVLQVGALWAGDESALWPDSWKRDYVRFENFLKVRAKSWPKAELEITPDGKVHSELLFGEQSKPGGGLDIYYAGVQAAGIALKPEGYYGRQEPIFGYFAPGIPLVAVTPPYAFPLVWLEVVPESGEELSLFGGDNRTLKMVKAPEPEAAFWPNERLFAWLHFQSLPRHHPDDIREKNTKANPAVFLQVDRDGVIHRQLLADAAAEKSLRWRVFYNGKLVEDSSANGSTELKVSQNGPGNYTALAGIEGKNGFLPVSNFLSYSIAPAGNNGKLTLLLFNGYDYQQYEKYPKWYRDILPPPGGFGPVRFANQEKLEEARKLLAAWQSCHDGSSVPTAPWILPDTRPALGEVGKSSP